MIEPIEFTTCELATIEFRPGDQAVLMFPDRLSTEQIKRIRDIWEECHPDIKVLVLESGGRLGIIRAHTEPTPFDLRP